MSKDRLEEMEELLNEYYENIDDPFASTDNAMAIVDKVSYFVNRVQELEEKLDEQVYSNKQLDKINRKWLRQNNRYREALLDVRETLNTSLSLSAEVYESVEIIDEALEESE